MALHANVRTTYLVVLLAFLGILKLVSFGGNCFEVSEGGLQTIQNLLDSEQPLVLVENTADYSVITTDQLTMQSQSEYWTLAKVRKPLSSIYLFRSVPDGRYLSVVGNQNVVKAMRGNSYDDPSFHWIISEIHNKNGSLKIQNVENGLCLESQGLGAFAAVTYCNDNDKRQLWRINSTLTII